MKRSSKSIFYGYWVLISCSLFAMVGAGGITTTFSVFINPLQADLGWSRTEIMAAFTFLVYSVALASPFAGLLVERFGASKVISVGALVTITGLFILTHINSLWHLYAGYLLAGLGIAATGSVTATYVVSHWFSVRRGLAIGILAMGMASGGIIFPPLTTIFLIPYFGWRGAYLAIAMINLAVIIPLSVLVVKTKPSDLALYGDGAHEDTNTQGLSNRDVSRSEAIPLRSALLTVPFWLIAVSLLLNHTHVGVFLSVFPHLRDMGFPLDIATSTISITSAMAFIGMLFFGWLCDRMKARYAAAIGLTIIVLGILMFMSLNSSSPIYWIWLYSIVMGLGMGSWLPTMSMLTSTTFGLAFYGSIFGMMSLFQNSGAGIGPLIAGYIYDTTQSYKWASVLILLMVTMAIPIVLAVRKPVLSDDI